MMPEGSLDNTRRLGFWSAILTAVSAAAFFGMGLFGSSYTEGIKYPYVLTTIRPLDYVVWGPAFILALAVVVLISCIHRQTPEDRKIFSQTALCFAVAYATLSTSDFFIQWTVVLPSILNNETVNLALFSIYNPHGIPIAVESLGYLLLNTALLFVVPVIDKRGRSERAIRWLFITGFILVVGAFGTLSLLGYPIVVFEVVAVTVNVAILIASGVLFSRLFRRATPAH
jgi:hypothetical protein